MKIDMENIGEGYILGNHYLDFDDDDKKVLVKALICYKNFCRCYSHVPRVFRDFSICESLLSKIS